MRFSVVLALVLSAIYAGSCRADSCPTILTNNPPTWDALYTSFKSYRQCDDGALGEGYSESVARLFVDRWNTLPQLSRLVRKDAGFRSFVLKHVDATLDTKDVQRIRRNARTRCPAGQREICNEVGKQAELALKQLKDIN
jgi:hypothetical protein